MTSSYLRWATVEKPHPGASSRHHRNTKRSSLGAQNHLHRHNEIRYGNVTVGREVPGVVAVLCVVSSGRLVLHIGITSCTFPPWTEMSKKNDYNYDSIAELWTIPLWDVTNHCVVENVLLERHYVTPVN